MGAQNEEQKIFKEEKKGATVNRRPKKKHRINI